MFLLSFGNVTIPSVVTALLYDTSVICLLVSLNHRTLGKKINAGEDDEKITETEI